MFAINVVQVFSNDTGEYYGIPFFAIHILKRIVQAKVHQSLSCADFAGSAWGTAILPSPDGVAWQPIIYIKEKKKKHLNEKCISKLCFFMC